MFPNCNDPRCDYIICFAYRFGKCTILENNFPKGDCPFYKTRDKHFQDVRKAEEHNQNLFKRR